TTSIDPNAILLASTTPPRGPSQAMQADTTSPEPADSPWQPFLPEETGDAAGTGPAFFDPEFQDLNALDLNTPANPVDWEPGGVEPVESDLLAGGDSPTSDMDGETPKAADPVDPADPLAGVDSPASESGVDWLTGVDLNNPWDPVAGLSGDWGTEFGPFDFWDPLVGADSPAAVSDVDRLAEAEQVESDLLAGVDSPTSEDGGTPGGADPVDPPAPLAGVDSPAAESDTGWLADVDLDESLRLLAELDSAFDFGTLPENPGPIGPDPGSSGVPAVGGFGGTRQKRKRTVASAIAQLSAVGTRGEADGVRDVAAEFVEWTRGVLGVDLANHSSKPNGFYDAVVLRFGKQLMNAGVERSSSGLRAWAARELAADLRRGGESKFSKLLPYPEVMSEQRREDLHRQWINKIANNQSRDYDVAHVVPHIIASMLSQSMRIHHPFGAPYDIGPTPDDGVIPYPVAFYKGAYYLGQLPDPADVERAGRIADGFPWAVISEDRQQQLNQLFDETRVLLRKGIEGVENSPYPTSSKHWPILRETFQRRLAAIRKDHDSPYSKKARELAEYGRYLAAIRKDHDFPHSKKARELAEYGRHLKGLGAEHLWEEKTTDFGGHFTLELSVLQVAKGKSQLRVWPGGVEKVLLNVDRLAILGDRVPVHFGVTGEEGVGFAEFRYTDATNGTDRIFYRRFPHDLSDRNLFDLREKAAGRVWDLHHRPLSSDYYQVTLPLREGKRLAGLFGDRSGNNSARSFVVPQVPVVGGLPPVLPAELNGRLLLGYSEEGRPTAIVEAPAEKNVKGLPLYLETDKPVLVVDDIKRLRKKALWEPENRWVLSEQVSFDVVLQPGARSGRGPLPTRAAAGPLSIEVGRRGPGRTLAGAEVDLSPGTSVTLSVGKWPEQEQVGADVAGSVPVVVGAPLVDGSGVVYRLFDTGVDNERFDDLKREITEALRNPGSVAAMPAGGSDDAAKNWRQEAASAIEQLSAAGNRDEQNFVRWTREVFGIDLTEGGAKPENFYDSMFRTFRQRFEELKIERKELHGWMASSLAADLRLGDASEFRKLLPYPEVMSEQRREELHQNWIDKIANSQSGDHDVAHVVVHILARTMSQPMRIYQPFGVPKNIGPESGANKLPIVSYKGAYYLGRPSVRGDADIAASIARGPEQTSTSDDEKQRLDRLFDQAHGLLLERISEAERNPHPGTRHWPALREAFQRKLAVIRGTDVAGISAAEVRPESPQQQADILAESRRYLSNILRPSSWEDADPRPQGGWFTQYLNVSSDGQQTTVSVELGGKRLRLQRLNNVSIAGDRIAVDFGMDSEEGFAVARIPYTATDGSERFAYREFPTRLTAADLEVVWDKAAADRRRKVDSAIAQLSARETGRELAAFEQWADAVFHIDRAEGDAGPLDVFYGTVLKAHGERLAQAGVTTVAELGALVARHLDADLRKGEESTFRALLPYPENMSEQRRETLHQHLLNKLVHRQPGYPDVVHVVPHIVAWGLGLPIEIHHPFGAPYVIGPPSGDGEIPQPVVWLDGAYHLGQARDPHDARIAEGFPSPAAYTELRRLDVVFDEALDLLKTEVDTAEQNTAIRHWPLLRDTFHRNLAAIRQRPSSPRRHADVLEEHRRYVDALREKSTWEDENRWNLQDPFTVPGRAEDTPGRPSLLSLRARRDGDDMLLGYVDRVTIPGDRVAVDFGIADGEGVGIARIPYTAPDGTERFVYKEIARRLTDSELAELWSTAAGPVWETVDRWTFGTLYHITAPVSESGIFDITFGDQRVTIPPVEVADGLPPVIAAELKEARFRLGYGMDSRPLAVLEAPAGRNGTAAPLYLELSSPAPTAHDIERLRSMALWESAEPGALLDEVSIDLVMQPDRRTPDPLPLTLGGDNPGRTLDGQEVDLSPGTEVTLRVGRFLRRAESTVVTSIFAAVKAPLADRSGNAYRLIDTNLSNEWFDGFKTQWETTGSSKRPAAPEWPAGPHEKRPRTGGGLAHAAGYRTTAVESAAEGLRHIPATITRQDVVGFRPVNNGPNLRAWLAGRNLPAGVDLPNEGKPAKETLREWVDDWARSLNGQRDPDDHPYLVSSVARWSGGLIPLASVWRLWGKMPQVDGGGSQPGPVQLTEDQGDLLKKMVDFERREGGPSNLREFLEKENLPAGISLKKGRGVLNEQTLYLIDVWARMMRDKFVARDRSGTLDKLYGDIATLSGGLISKKKVRLALSATAGGSQPDAAGMGGIDASDAAVSEGSTVGAGAGAPVVGPDQSAPGTLSTEEFQVLVHLAAGLTNKQITTLMAPRSEPMVAKIVRRLRNSLGVGSRQEAVTRARQLGLLGDSAVRGGASAATSGGSTVGDGAGPASVVVSGQPASEAILAPTQSSALHRGAAGRTTDADVVGPETGRLSQPASPGSARAIEIDAELWRRRRGVNPFDGMGGSGRLFGELVAVRFALIPGDEKWVIQRRLYVQGSDAAVQQVQEATLAGVAALNESEPTLPEVEKRLWWEVEFVAKPELAHQEVMVGAPGSVTDQRHWAAGEEPGVYVHEVVHGAGVLDRKDSSLMGQHRHGADWRLSNEDLQDIVDILKPHYAGVVGSSGPAERPQGAASAAQGPASVQQVWRDGHAVPPGFPGYGSGVSDAPLNPGGGEPPIGAGRVVAMEVDAEPRTPGPPPVTMAPVPPEIVISPAWDDVFQQVLESAGGQVAETLGLPTAGIDDVRHYLAAQLGLIVQRTDFRKRHGLPDLSLERLQQALDSRGSSVPGLTHVLPHLVSEAFGINFAVSGSETVRHDQGVGAGRGLPHRHAGWGPAAAHSGSDSGQFGSEPMVRDTGDRAGLPAEVADESTAGDPSQLTDGYTITVTLGPMGRLPVEVDGKSPSFGVELTNRNATLVLGYRADGPHARKPAALIMIEGEWDSNSYWQWLDPAPTEKDLGRLRNYEPRTVGADGWRTEPLPPLDGYDKWVRLSDAGRLTSGLNDKRPRLGPAAKNRRARLRVGFDTDRPDERELVALIEVESLDDRPGGPFWKWLAVVPTEKDLEKLKPEAEQRGPDRPRPLPGEWTQGDPPQPTDGHIKKVWLDWQARFSLNGERVSFGRRAGGQEATLWLGKSHDGEPAAWLKVERLKRRESGPFWRWLHPVPTEADLRRLETYEPGPNWTEGNPPQLTGGSSPNPAVASVKFDGRGRLKFSVGGKRLSIGRDFAHEEVTLALGYRTDGPHAGKPAAWVKVESLKGGKGGPFWRWLDVVPTEDDLASLRSYGPRRRPGSYGPRLAPVGPWQAWTPGDPWDPPQLTGGYSKTFELSSGRLPVEVGGKRQYVGVEYRKATVWFGYLPPGPHEGEPAALVEVGSLDDGEGGPFRRWLDPAPTQEDLGRLKDYEPRTVYGDFWRDEDPPPVTGWDTKTVKLGPEGRLPFKVDGKRPIFSAAGGREMTIRFGPLPPGPHEGEPAAFIEVEGLDDRHGGPFWQWLSVVRTPADLETLRTYEPRGVHAGEWTEGKLPQLTGGYTITINLGRDGEVPFKLNGKRGVFGAGTANAGREATVWLGRTDGSPEGEPAARIEVESLEGWEGGPFWRWLNVAPTENDLVRLRKKYKRRTVNAGGGTAGDPPLLTGGSSDNAAAVAPASTGSVGVAYRAAQDDAVAVPGSNTDDAIPPVAGSWARPVVGIPSQGQQRPGVASAQVDRGQPAVRTPMAAPAPQPQPLEGWPQAAAGQAGATQRPANAFWDVAVDRSSLVSVQRPAVASVAGPDPMLPVPADGYCVLYAFIATDPIWVRDVLYPHLSVDLVQFLSDPGRVRTSVVGLVGSEVPRESPLARVSALLQGHVRGYLDSNAGRLPTDVTRQRINFREERVRQVAALNDHQQVLDWLRYLDSPYVTEAGMLPAAVIAHRYQAVRAAAMLSGGPLGLGEPTDAPQRQLDFLTQHGQGFPVDVLEPGTARDFLVVVLSESDRQLDPDELDVVRAAVDNWKQQWGAPVGEFLPPLLAYATGSRVTIWRESGWGAPPMMSDEYGPAAGRPVDLYHVAADPHTPTIVNHYNAAAVHDGRQGAGAFPATSAPVDPPAWQAQVGQGQPAAQTPSPPQLTATLGSGPDPDQPDPEPRTTPLERRHLDKVRTEIIWATPEEVSAEQDVVLMRE
ncbi:hypothetical protein ACFY2R_28525, partial [Micromonospora olivasterospora]